MMHGEGWGRGVGAGAIWLEVDEGWGDKKIKCLCDWVRGREADRGGARTRGGTRIGPAPARRWVRRSARSFPERVSEELQGRRRDFGSTAPRTQARLRGSIRLDSPEPLPVEMYQNGIDAGL